MPGRGWSRAYCRGVAGLGGTGARPPAGLIWSPAVLRLAVGLGDPWAHCRGVAARWLDAECCRPRAYGGGLGSCGVAVGADHGVSSDAWSRGSRGDHGGGGCGLVQDAYRPLDWA